MKAIQFAQFGGPEVLELQELPEPLPAANEVLIEVAAAGVNFRDVRERAGVYQRADAKLDGVGLPKVPGAQVVGTVTQVGSDGDPALLGKTVMAQMLGGGYAEYATALAAFVIPLPTDSNPYQIATLPGQGLSAYLMLTESTKVAPGESVLVHGAAGGVGSLAVQIAKLLGADKVVGTASTEEKRQYAKSLGADVAVDYNKSDWPKAVLNATDGKGVDIILESIGGDGFERNFECLASQGRVILYASLQGAHPPFSPRLLIMRSQTLTGFFGGTFFVNRPDLLRGALQFLVEQTISGGIRPPLDHTLPLSQAAEAHRLLEARQVKGVLVLDPKS